MQAGERAAPGNCRCRTGGRAVWCLTGRANASSQIMLVCRVENAAIRLNCGCADLFNPVNVSVSEGFDARCDVASSRSKSRCVETKLR